MCMIKNHFMVGVNKALSPNYNERPDKTSIFLVVIHSISLPPNKFANGYIEKLFTNKLDFNAHPYFKTIRGLKVSAHLLIKRDGNIIQFVPFNKRAWHAGESSFKGKQNCNDFSIGIELEGGPAIRYSRAQYHVVNKVLAVLKLYYPISDIVGHSDIAPGRKIDPGDTFKWEKINACG